MPQNQPTVNSTKIYETAKSLLGEALAADAMLGCMETVNVVAEKALGAPICVSPSTADGWVALQDATKYTKIMNTPLPGDIIISPTGKGNGVLAHGHIGIVALYGILSNNSEDGRLEEVWNMQTWQNFYGRYGGFPVEFYRIV